MEKDGLILVTGAAGKTGQAVLRALAQHGAATRAFVRRAEQEEIVRAAGASQAVSGLFLDPVALDRACHGVSAVYHICPNMSPDEETIGRAMIAAARGADVKRFVFHSVLHPETEAMPHHWRKMRVEEQLLASGLDFTVLRPAAYMQNLRASWSKLIEDGLYSVPYSLTSRVALVDLEDVAEVAARVLTEPGHESATYELCSGEALDQNEIAATLEEVLGRPVRAVVEDRQDGAEKARAAGLSEEVRADLLAMFRYYERHGLPGNGRVLSWLLGRPATTLSDYVRRTAGKSAG